MVERLTRLPSQRLVLIVLLIAVLANGVVWSFVIPFDGAPDEVHKYDIVYFIWKYNRLPVFGPQPSADVYIRPAPGTRDGYVYGIAATYPPGAFLLSTALMHLTLSVDPVTLLHAARLAVVLCNVALACLVFQIVFMLFGSGTYALGVAAFIAFIPQVAYTGAYVGDDTFTAAAVTFTLWTLIRGISRGWTRSNAMLMGFALAVTALGKQNGWAAVLPFVVLALWSTRPLNWGERLRIVLKHWLVAWPDTGAWLGRNWMLYRDWLAFGVSTVAWRDYMTRLGMAWRPLSAQGIGPGDLFSKTLWLQYVFESFWGLFFYLNVPMLPVVYSTLQIVCALGILVTIGVIASSGLRRQSLFLHTFAWQVMLCVLISFVILLATNIWTNVTYDFQPQGRYFFPVLVPIGIALTLGLYRLEMNRPRAAQIVWGAVLIAMVALNVYALSVVRAHPYPAIPLPNF